MVLVSCVARRCGRCVFPLFLVAMIGLILSSCLPKQSPPRLKDEVPLVALGLLDGEDAAVDPLPVRLQEELNEALATRNILPQWSGPEGAGSLRSTAARWEAALAGAEAAPLVLLAEVRARFDSLLEGRFRWTVSVTLTLGPRDRPAARSDRRFDGEGAGAPPPPGIG